MANGVGPFGIVPVDIAGQFLKVGQAKANALNFEIAQEELSAFRQSRESQRKLTQIREENLPAALEGDQEAIGNLSGVLDVGEIIKLDKNSREKAQENLDRGADLAFSALRNEESFNRLLPQLKERAADFGIDPANIPDNFKEAKPILEQFLIMSSDAKNMFDILGGGKKLDFVATGKRDENGNLIIDKIVDLRDPDAIDTLNKAVERGGLVFDPKSAATQQGLGDTNSRINAFRAQKIDAANLIKDINAIEERLAKGGTKITGFTGNLAELVSDIQVQIQATGELIGFAEFSENFDEFLSLADAEDAATIRAAGAQNAALEADIKALAYMTAIARFGQEGRGLSDNDFKIAMKIVAGSSQDPAKMLLVMEGNKEAIIRRLKTTAQGSEGLLQFDSDQFNRQFELVGSENNAPTQAEINAAPIITDPAEIAKLNSGDLYQDAQGNVRQRK